MDLPAPAKPEKQHPALVSERFKAIGPAELIQAFLNRRNPNTMAAYRRDLETFRVWLGADTLDEAAQILISDQGRANAIALGWKQHLVEQKLAPSTINRRLAALRSMIEMASRLGMVTWELKVDNIPTKDYRDTTGTGTDGFKAILSELNGRKQTIKIRRDRMIVYLLYSLALRRHEVCQLDVADVDFHKRRLQIRGKGRSQSEFVTMPDGVAAVVRAWLEVRGTQPGSLISSLDPAGKGDGRLSLRSVSRLVRKLGITADVDGATPHGLRHASVTAALNVTNGDVRAVQRFSRHSRVETVLVYDDNRQDLGGQIAEKLQAELEKDGDGGG